VSKNQKKKTERKRNRGERHKRTRVRRMGWYGVGYEIVIPYPGYKI
jgi:hypothetical protein